MPRLLEVRRGVYRDSVTLMQVSRQVSSVSGVESAMVGMATPLNVELIAGMGFAVPEVAPSDLMIAVIAEDDAAQAAALAALDAALQDGGSSAGLVASQPGDSATRPATLGTAARHARYALISVPGEHAFTEAMDAIESGMHVMVFSDNVPLDQEVRLKEAAADAGLLVMGPDCGTAIIGGVGLGFANVCAPGPVGIVAASGTGAQQLCALLDAGGAGISHCLGVGGRDLSREVAGRSTLTALSMLDEDPATDVIVLVSKPPDPWVVDRINEHVATLGTPVIPAYLGDGRPDLTSVARGVLGRLGLAAEFPTWGSRAAASGLGGSVVGLFCGGTLCDEAMIIASQQLGAIYSNIPLRPDWALTAGAGHRMIDFGDDTFTQGRAHPMIDPALRDEHLRAAMADPATGVILLDVVLGHGAHPDPAEALSALIEGSPKPVIITLVGTTRDPQSLHAQADRLAAAGALVFLSNAEATRCAIATVGGLA